MSKANIKFSLLNTILNILKGYWPGFIAIGYLIGFLYYHASMPATSLRWQKSLRYKVGDSCTLLVEYPSEIPLEPPNKPGRPVTVRLWFTPTSLTPTETFTIPRVCSSTLTLSATTPLSYFVDLGPLGDGLVFTDKEGETVPASIPVQPALTKSAASPNTLYIRRGPSSDMEPITVSVQVRLVYSRRSNFFLDTRNPKQKPFIRPETEDQSLWRHLEETLFTPEPLQVIFPVIGGLFAIWRGYAESREWLRAERERAAERRQSQRARIDSLGEEFPEKAFRSYISLRKEFKDDLVLLEELRNAFKPSWAPYLRQQLSRYLYSGQLKNAEEFLEEFKWEWEQV